MTVVHATELELLLAWLDSARSLTVIYFDGRIERVDPVELVKAIREGRPAFTEATPREPYTGRPGWPWRRK